MTKNRTQYYEVLAIGKEDSYYPDRKDLIGCIVRVSDGASDSLDHINGSWYSGSFKIVKTKKSTTDYFLKDRNAYFLRISLKKLPQ